MDTITRDVRDLPKSERSALERLIGHELRETERVIVQIINVVSETTNEKQSAKADFVPQWWNIYDGLSDSQVDLLDKAVTQRVDMTRSTE